MQFLAGTFDSISGGFFRAVLPLLIVLSSCDAQETYDYSNELSDEDILHNFDTILFEREFGASDYTVKKWRREIFVDFFGVPTPEHGRIIEEHLLDLSSLTGILFRENLNGTNNDSLLRVFFVSSEEAEELLEKQPPNDPFGISDAISVAFLSNNVSDRERCSFSFNWNDSDLIVLGHVFIHSAIPASEANMCIVEELAQVLGLPNDSESAGPTIFNDDGEFVSLTIQDRLFFKMLYDDGIRPGMSRTSVLKQAAVVLAGLREGDRD